MAKNSLTARQDIVTRAFLVEVALAENVFDNNPATKKRLIGAVYDLLNYQRLNDGRFISKDKKITYLLGGTVSREEFPDEWGPDYERALLNVDKEEADVSEQLELFTADREDSNKANSGKPSKSSSLWKTLFSKDV